MLLSKQPLSSPAGTKKTPLDSLITGSEPFEYPCVYVSFPGQTNFEITLAVCWEEGSLSSVTRKASRLAKAADWIRRRSGRAFQGENFLPWCQVKEEKVKKEREKVGGGREVER